MCGVWGGRHRLAVWGERLRCMAVCGCVCAQEQSWKSQSHLEEWRILKLYILHDFFCFTFFFHRWLYFYYVKRKQIALHTGIKCFCFQTFFYSKGSSLKAKKLKNKSQLSAVAAVKIHFWIPFFVCVVRSSTSASDNCLRNRILNILSGKKRQGLVPSVFYLI